jgi:hypothetical protein
MVLSVSPPFAVPCTWMTMFEPAGAELGVVRVITTLVAALAETANPATAAAITRLIKVRFIACLS